MLRPGSRLPSLEQSKSIVIAALGILLGLSLLQLRTDATSAVQDRNDRDSVASVARRFAIGLTTYDFAHTAIQREQMTRLCSKFVVNRIARSEGDVVAVRASSLGSVVDAVVVAVKNSRADVLVKTLQVVTSQFQPSGHRLEGLVRVTEERSATAWIVTDYEWLLVPTNSP